MHVGFALLNINKIMQEKMKKNLLKECNLEGHVLYQNLKYG